MAQEPSGSVHQHLYRLAAAVEVLTDKTKEMTEGAKSRDQKLEQIGDSVRSQGDQLRELSRSAERQQKETAAKLSEAKHETNNHLQTISGKVEILDRHVTGMDGKLETLQQEVKDLKDPVEQLLALRRNVYAIAALLSSIFATLWVVGQPIVSWLTTHFLAVWFPGGKS